MKKLNIMIVGVGGQGTLLASKIIGEVAQRINTDVKVSEVHGMAQRGGSVVTYVKMDSKVWSPVIEKGEADIILAFEKLEAGRWADYLKEGGTILINDQRIDPMPVITGAAKYPSSIIDNIKGKVRNTFVIDAAVVAKECGNIKATNVVMIGLLARNTDIPEEIWLESIKASVPSRFLDLNIKAFQKGYNLMSREGEE